MQVERMPFKLPFPITAHQMPLTTKTNKIASTYQGIACASPGLMNRKSMREPTPAALCFSDN